MPEKKRNCGRTISSKLFKTRNLLASLKLTPSTTFTKLCISSRLRLHKNPFSPPSPPLSSRSPGCAAHPNTSVAFENPLHYFVSYLSLLYCILQIFVPATAATCMYNEALFKDRRLSLALYLLLKSFRTQYLQEHQDIRFVSCSSNK